MKFLRIFVRVLLSLPLIIAAIAMAIGVVIDPLTRKIVFAVLGTGFLFVYLPYRIVRGGAWGDVRMMVVRGLLIQMLLASAAVLGVLLVALYVSIFFFSSDSPQLSPGVMSLLRAIGAFIEGIVNPWGAGALAAALVFLTSGVLLLKDSRTGLRYFEMPPNDEQSAASAPVRRDINDWFPDERALVFNIATFLVLLLFGPLFLGMAVSWYTEGFERDLSAESFLAMMGIVVGLANLYLIWQSIKKLKPHQ